MKEALYIQIKEIKNKDVQDFVRAALDNAPEGFWHSPCSGTGRYHPPENQGEAGIIRHLIKCVVTAKDLCRYFDLPEKDKDIVLAAIFLHDIKKNGEPWKQSTDMYHGKIAADFLDRFQLKEPEKTQIKNCVRYHMGRFTGSKEDIERASNPDKREFIVQLTDLFCSRKYASWLPGHNVEEESIQGFLNKVKQGDDYQI